MSELIIVAIISLMGTLGGSYFAQRKTTALVIYRLEELEKKVEKHNNVIDRTYALERENTVQNEKLAVTNNRLKDLERR